MAGEEFIGLLGPSDLNQFSQSIEQSDPYGLAGRSLMQWQPNYSTFSAGEGAATSFGKAFLGSILQNYARNNAADQLGSVVGVLPQLGKDPMSVAMPEGVDSNAFNLLRGTAVIKNAQQQAFLDKQKDTRISGLLGSILPELVRGRQLSTDDALKIAASNDPTSELANLTKKAAPEAVVAAGPINPLASGKESSSEKYKKYFADFLSSGQPPVQAAAAARTQVEGEIKANNKSFDEAKSAREYGQNLMQLANTARAGMDAAGNTGPFNGMASAYEHIANLFGSSEAKSQLTGDAVLDSVAPDVIKMARPTGGGATSDFEAKTYLGSGPNTSNIPGANAVLIQKLDNLGKLNLDYADFLEAYKEANSGSVSGASKKWGEYKQAFPIFKGGEIDTKRPSWQEFFESVGSQGSPVGGGSEPVPTGEVTKSGKPVYMINGVKGTLD